MLGAIIGDIVGSIYEFESEKSKDFELFTPKSRLTDDSLMTLAVGCACTKADLNDEEDFKSWVDEFFKDTKWKPRYYQIDSAFNIIKYKKVISSYIYYGNQGKKL